MKFTLALSLLWMIGFHHLSAQSHFISNENYRTQVQEKYNSLKQTYGSEIFQQIEDRKQVLSTEEQEAYQFLFAYMPLNDLADYPAKQYAELVYHTFLIRDTISWGKTVPEDIFRHFVLPLRVNNENLDYSRVFFYKQLNERVQGMDMLQAALEINHWCHEHVTYQASDSRTSSPITTYLNGYGRCGEESTFTVAALRSVGIPARQVYTPRWAHTDDNHAWVEFWANGKWYFLGACEPAPEANMGWFTEPARRAMLVNTRVIGQYQGKERTVVNHGNYSIINTLNVYAKTKVVYAKVSDSQGNPIEGVHVDFQLYNYGEYFTIAPKTTDKNGIASFESGLGSLLVWAHKGEKYQWENINLNTIDTVYFTLEQQNEKDYIIDLDYAPPVKPDPIIVSPSGKAANEKCLKGEDQMRMEYEKTFMDSAQCQTMAVSNKIDFTTLWPIIHKSRANWREVKKFIDGTPKAQKPLAMDLLKVLAIKDLHDIKSAILEDHLRNCPSFSESGTEDIDMYNQYVLNPRISLEMITSWRSFIQENIPLNEYSNWVKKNIQINNSLNFYSVPISPEGIYKTKYSDQKSADILQVAIYRSYGIPARLESGTMAPQFYAYGEWHIMSSKSEKTKILKQSDGYLNFLSTDQNDELLYYKHFTVAQLRNGQYYTLEYDWDKKLKDFSTLKLKSGKYRLTTGNRLSDGSVLVHFNYFTINPQDTFSLDVKLRKQDIRTVVLGQLPKVKVQLLKDVEDPKARSTEPTYQIYVWYSPNNEPSKHAIQDLGAVKTRLEQRNIPLKLISGSKVNIEKLDAKYFGNLPPNTMFLYDPRLKGLSLVEKNISKKIGSEFPYIFLVNPKNEIIYFKEGYSIGVGEEILKMIPK